MTGTGTLTTLEDFLSECSYTFGQVNRHQIVVCLLMCLDRDRIDHAINPRHHSVFLANNCQCCDLVCLFLYTVICSS